MRRRARKWRDSAASRKAARRSRTRRTSSRKSSSDSGSSAKSAEAVAVACRCFMARTRGALCVHTTSRGREGCGCRGAERMMACRCY
ncbi:Os03g0178550 [Oryza sativa Japonica Group]|uniref:Os03g0178550 protein n=1 Tax=Oryza sativa subsp. japonica TaxID=39947 RepID=A0A0P0VTU4_ORYSJ|nr:hypothetical protein EE612_015657 [Oryza sativa]BAS82599.1 Os03g0178550 [Oryza sativa Japonica Group]